MSATSQGVEGAVDACRPTDVTPVELDASALSSTAPSYLRELKAELTAEGCQPAAIRAKSCFAEDCPLATQEEADRLRGIVRAAAFLGAGQVTVEVERAADADAATTALAALTERAEREGVSLTITGAVSLPQ